jgi:hypothetical protein
MLDEKRHTNKRHTADNNNLVSCTGTGLPGDLEIKNID